MFQLCGWILWNVVGSNGVYVYGGLSSGAIRSGRGDDSVGVYGAVCGRKVVGYGRIGLYGLWCWPIRNSGWSNICVMYGGVCCWTLWRCWWNDSDRM